MDVWLRTDEIEEVLKTLSACKDFLERACDDIAYWKWVSIALHNAVQGAMVVGLRRTDGFGPIREDIAKKWYKAYRETGETKRIKEKLMNFLELYEKIKKKGTLQMVSVSCYVPPDNQDLAMEKLNEIRNDFIHFVPKGWSLELSGAPTLCLSVLNVIEFLVTECAAFMMHPGLERKDFIKEISLVRDELIHLEQKYA